MRLRRLHLTRFGHFTDHTLDFGPAGDAPDFHIVYGPNEAGKTTTMEAALRLFYGFRPREPYDFRHQRANLRVAAEIEAGATTQHLVRLPTRAGSLQDAAGNALPETAVSAMLGGLSETDYRNLLCLDDDTIERGGEEIVQAKGDIGRLLFAAASGVSDLSPVLHGARAEADALWGKRRSRTRIAELKRDLRTLEAEIRAQDISASAWKRLQKDLTEAEARETTTREARDALRRGEAELAAERSALPRLAEIDRISAALDPLTVYFGSVPAQCRMTP